MDEKQDEKQSEIFDLESIMREFSPHRDDPVPEAAEPSEAPEEPGPEAPEEAPAAVPEDAPENPREEPMEKAPEDGPEEGPEETAEESPEDAPGEMEDTVRLDSLKNLETPTEPEPAPIPPAPEDLGPEPFSQEWEPKYDEPMGEYVPPRPIVFRPRSRLAELKRKLIAGPEKRYYELVEQGVVKLQIAILLNLIVVLLSAGATAMYAAGMVPDSRLRLMVFGQFFAMLLSALLGSGQFIDGLSDLFRGRFSLNTMLTLTFLACCADGVYGLMEQRIPCCAAFSLEMLMAQWSSYEKRVTERGQMDTLRKAVRLDRLSAVPDYLDGKTGLLRDEGQVEDFMDTYRTPSKPEKRQNLYALAALVICLGLAGVGAALHGISFGVQVLAVSLLAAVPASFFVALSRPMAVLERKLHSVGAVLCGWQGVMGLSGKAVVPLEHQDLFPSGSVAMNGVKFYGVRNTDEVLSYATALVSAAGGSLVPLFNQLLDSRNGLHYQVENLNLYDNGGIGGEINGEPAVLGVLSFMKDMGVEVPTGTSVDQAVYVAIDGELCGVFALSYTRVKSAAAGLATLCGYRQLEPVLVSPDFMLTAGFIRSRLGVNPRRLRFPEPAQRTALAAVKPAEDAPALALITREGLACPGFAITGARALRTASNAGVAVHILGGLAGLAVMALLAVLGRADLLTPVNLFLYQLVWMVPGLLVTEWTRNL